ncbi:MAG: DUF2127 domain-containing protein [Patescibacteria group bacterium]
MRNYIHKIFLFSIGLKGINGFFQLIGGYLLLFYYSQHVSVFFTILLGDDPSSPLISHLFYRTENLSISTRLFFACYLLVHGIINIALVISLKKKIHIAYPISTGFFFAFMMYEFFRFCLLPSWWLAGLLVIDAVVIYSILCEYRKVLHLKKSESLLV